VAVRVVPVAGILVCAITDKPACEYTLVCIMQLIGHDFFTILGISYFRAYVRIVRRQLLRKSYHGLFYTYVLMPFWYQQGFFFELLRLKAIRIKFAIRELWIPL
jgi:hypothetical protein